jgi:hypothetical protein
LEVFLRNFWYEKKIQITKDSDPSYLRVGLESNYQTCQITLDVENDENFGYKNLGNLIIKIIRKTAFKQ